MKAQQVKQADDKRLNYFQQKMGSLIARIHVHRRQSWRQRGDGERQNRRRRRRRRRRSSSL
jgi:hypothetical protein